MAVKCAPILSPVQEILADYFYGVGCASGDEDPKNRFIQHYLLNLDFISTVFKVRFLTENKKKEFNILN